MEKEEAVPSSNMEEQEDSEDEGLREYMSAIKPVQVEKQQPVATKKAKVEGFHQQIEQHEEPSRP